MINSAVMSGKVQNPECAIQGQKFQGFDSMPTIGHQNYIMIRIMEY